MGNMGAEAGVKVRTYLSYKLIFYFKTIVLLFFKKRRAAAGPKTQLNAIVPSFVSVLPENKTGYPENDATAKGPLAESAVHYYGLTDGWTHPLITMRRRI